MTDLREEVLAACAASRGASVELRQATRTQKDVAITAIADGLVADADKILAANAQDVQRAKATGTDAAMIDRLTLDAIRLSAIAEAARDVVQLADPVGQMVREYTLPNGLNISQVRVPLGVVAMIYEARPNVTVDAAVLCLKSGNAALLRGSSSAAHTNAALTESMRSALARTDLPADSVVMVPGESREAVDVVMRARGLVDVIIPRGGASLIQNVVMNSVVPVIETGVGNCHLYIDKGADLDTAVAIAVNAKTQRVSVCNTLETLLVHADVADEFLPRLMLAYKDKGVTVHGDPTFVAAAEDAGVVCLPATDEDWATEYLSLDIAARVVPDLEAAIAHIQRWSTGHTEAIVTKDQAAADRFVQAIDSAAVMVNASTRFTDGGEFGFGAEIGISTQKLHARGPMGLPELTSTKYIVKGSGQVRG